MKTMQRKDNKDEKLVKVSEAALLSLVADRLKGRNLFPEKVEEAKKYLQNAKLPAL
ncbi:MAG: hypothetical protein ACTHMM_12485 [Agriterribacter sp.]